VHFINDNIAEIREETRPLLMILKNGKVRRVRIREDEMGLSAAPSGPATP